MLGSAYGIRTHDLRLERAVSLATRRTRHAGPHFVAAWRAIRGWIGRPWLVPGATAIIFLAGDRGFEPRLTEPESVVLPLDESPT